MTTSTTENQPRLLRWEGRMLADLGHFEARLRLPRGKERLPVYNIRYRVRADATPTTDGVLRSLQFTLLSKFSIESILWTTVDGETAGLSVEKAPACARLGKLLFGGASAHPRYPVIEAWEQCIYWSAAGCRERLPAGQTYTARDYLEDRRKAVAALHKANRAHPPAKLTDSYEVFYASTNPDVQEV